MHLTGSSFPRQRWGILPTRAFWERPHFWRSARVFMVPLLILEARAMAEVTFQHAGWLRWAGMAGMAAVMILTQGLLERYIRSPVKDMTDEERYQVLPCGAEDPAAIRRAVRARNGLIVMAILVGVLASFQASTSRTEKLRRARRERRPRVPPAPKTPPR
jgi:hypothetical protein